ncbi:MAG: polysaccharide biosynthesis/export family protein, partial [Planctomycetales bacterium]|nr:polysaccharide biosynthesis/export family protein [Planctomycetales bacterium]
MNVESRDRSRQHWLLRGLAVVLLLGSGANESSAQVPSRYVPVAPTSIAGFDEGISAGGTMGGIIGNCETCRNCPIEGVDCLDQSCGPELSWRAHRPLPWQVLAQGEYIGPSRTAHVPQYRLRVDDVVVFIFRLTRTSSGRPYELNVGDKIRVESLQDDNLDRELVIQPDGTITLRLLGQVAAAGMTIETLRANLEKLYTKYYKEPTITVTPVQVNTKLEDLRSTVDNRQGVGGQSVRTSVSPDGTVQLPALGSVPAQGLSLDELKAEVDERYRMIVDGIEVTPVLLTRAPRHIFVLGEVRSPGRYDL